MLNKHENVILFPTWRKSLEKESLQALEQKRYSEALSKLNKLLNYKINNHEILIGKLICLMELGRNDEAQSLCEELIKHKTENYYHYVHIYLTILFQTNQYVALMEHVEYELKDSSISETVKEQFQQLYEMSNQLNNDFKNEKSVEYMLELTDAFDNEHHVRQWELINNLRKMEIKPTNKIVLYLTDNSVHPVIKTAIFNWLQDELMTEEVEVHKLNHQIKISPASVPKIRSHTVVKQIILAISDLEQKNPTLFILLEQLLYRYAYVRFPIMPHGKDVMVIADALKNIGERYLHSKKPGHMNDNIEEFMEEIEWCETLYLSVISE